MNKQVTEGKKQGDIVGIFSALKAESIQEVLLERSKQAALAFGVALLEQDVEALCGPRFARKAESQSYRGGSDRTSIVLDGAKYQMPRPRVRDANGEVDLPMLRKLQDSDLLDRQIQQRMLVGVSTRNYDKVISSYSKKLGVSKSSVSRAFVRSSQKDLDAINQGDLSSYRCVALMIDGIEIAGRTVVAALGITNELVKVPIGLKEGDTENSDLVRELLSSVQDRGFTLCCQRLLAVIDGSRALAKGLKSVFGDRVIIQRCWLHKVRNLQTYLPKQHHRTALWRMRKMMSLRSFDEALRELNSLIAWLEEISPDAATSLREAGTDLLTLHTLGIAGELRKSLSSTNLIESLFSVVRTGSGRVKNWKSGAANQRMRWIASSITMHKKKMRKLRGLPQRQNLISALGEKLEALAA